MPIIRPIRDLRDTNEISRLVMESNEPVHITKNGRNNMVLMSDQIYDDLIGKLEIYQKLAVAEAQILNGEELIDGKKALKELRAKYGR